MLGSVLQQRFHLDTLLRRGRSGVAYLATDQASGELFAVKMFARGAAVELAAGHAYRALLSRLDGLNHPHLIVATAVGQHEGQWFEAAPYFPGDPAAGEPGRPGLASGAGIEVLRQLAEGLAALHGRGTVHGGILPRRILVSRVDGVHAVLLAPARHLLAAGQALPAEDAPFSAPEQDPRHPLPVDPRADLYALGAFALSILTGPSGTAAAILHEPSPSRLTARSLSTMFRTLAEGTRSTVRGTARTSESEPSLLHRVEKGSGDEERLPEARPAGRAQEAQTGAGIEAAERARSAPEVPTVLRPILGRLLAVNPEDRYASANDLLADLQSVGYGGSAPQPARREEIDPDDSAGIHGSGMRSLARPAARPQAAAPPLPGPEEIAPDGAAGIVSGRIGGLARLAVPANRRAALDRYYEALEFTLSLHRMTLVARGQAGWCAISSAGPLGAFWAMQSILPLVGEFDVEAGGEGEDEPGVLRTGIGLHAAVLSAPRASAPHPPALPRWARDRLSPHGGEGELAEPFAPPGKDSAAEPAGAPLLTGDPFSQAARLADLSAFLRAGAVFSPEMTASLPPAWNTTLRPLGPWRVGLEADPRELFAFAGGPGAGASAPGFAGLEPWQRALEAYRARDWRNAIAALKSFLAGHPGDRLARLLLRHSLRRYGEPQFVASAF